MVFSFCMSMLFSACSSCDNSEQKASAATPVQACKWLARHGQWQERHTCKTRGAAQYVCTVQNQTPFIGSQASTWTLNPWLSGDCPASQNAHTPRAAPCRAPPPATHNQGAHHVAGFPGQKGKAPERTLTAS